MIPISLSWNILWKYAILDKFKFKYVYESFEDFVKMKILIQQVWDGVWDSAFLTSYMLMLCLWTTLCQEAKGQSE